MMTLDKAQMVLKAAIAKAQEIGQPMNVAVVDAGTNLTAFIPMDGAWLGSIDIAINKAFTAKAFNLSTLELGRNSQPGDQFFGIYVSNHARVMIFAGGIPIKANGEIVGAVGVSGGSGSAQDQAVAEAAGLLLSHSITGCGWRHEVAETFRGNSKSHGNIRSQQMMTLARKPEEITLDTRSDTPSAVGFGKIFRQYRVNAPRVCTY